MKIFKDGPPRRLMVATVVAMTTMAVVMWLLTQHASRDSAPVKTVPVLIAKNYIAGQSELNSACCYEKHIPEAFAPPRPLAKKDLGSAGATRWRARGEILKGEMLTASRVVDAAASTGISSDIKETETALMVHLTPEGALSGVVSPGDRVHVLSVSEKRACVLVSSVRVATVGRRSFGVASDGATSIDETLLTLMLTPRDALRVSLAAQKSVLSVTLVSPLATRTASGCVSAEDL